jgi:hypothetical protein
MACSECDQNARKLADSLTRAIGHLIEGHLGVSSLYGLAAGLTGISAEDKALFFGLQSYHAEVAKMMTEVSVVPEVPEEKANVSA